MTQPKSYRDVQKSKICAGRDYIPQGGRKPDTWGRKELTAEIVKLMKSKDERTLTELSVILYGHPDRGKPISEIMKVMEALGLVTVRTNHNRIRTYRWVKND